MIEGLIALVACLLLMGYGFARLFGENTANRYARGVGRAGRAGVRRVGRGTGRTAVRHPMAAGIIVILLVLLVMSRC